MVKKKNDRAAIVALRLLGSDVQARIIDALNDCYTAIRFDSGWDRRLPSDEEFVDVMRDQVAHHGKLPVEDLAAFRALPAAAQRALILRMGL